MTPSRRPWIAVITFGRMVKFSHTVFALPFALAAVTLAAHGHGVTVAQLAAIVLAMVGARTAAMGFNRIVDRRIDAANPRTAGRELPTGKVSLPAAASLTVASAALFLAAAAWLCHLFLGLAIGSAPAAAWIAVRGRLDAPALWLSLAVATWIAGFDVLYALDDRDFDRNAGIHSIPARFGVPAALALSAVLHAVSAAALLIAGHAAGLGWIYLLGMAVVIAMLIWEHAILRPSDLSRLNVAFFNLNGYVSVVYFAATLADVLVRQSHSLAGM
jgi:4-hydroxybenzoate polyprenyltransferase